MKALQKRSTGNLVRLMGIDELRDYLGVGRSTAIKIGEQSGAKKKLGRRALYDREIIDRYIDSLGV